MLKHVISYTDFNGEQREEPHYFNLTRAELIELEHSVKGGLSAVIEELQTSHDNPRIMELFKKIITMSYGKKTPDGRFAKSQEIVDEFLSSAAYDELIVNMFTDAKFAADFTSRILPSKEELERVKALAAKNKNENNA